MAPKRNNDQSGQRPNSHLRVLFVELSGADATIEEALRTVERMRRPAEPHTPKQVDSGSGGGGASPAPENGRKTTLESTPGDLFDLSKTPNGGDGGNGDTETEQEPNIRVKRGQGVKRDYNVSIVAVGDLDFVPEGKPSLKDFFAEKAPKSDMEQTLVICFYFQHILRLQPFGPGHILSAFRDVDQPVPTDLKKTIRNMEKLKAWVNTQNLDDLRTTTMGDNYVKHEMGKKEANGKGA